MRIRYIIAFLFLTLPVVSYSAEPLAQTLRARITQALRTGEPMKVFFEKIHREYGEAAISPLTQITQNEKETDEVRWFSLFGLGRLAGKESLPVIKPLMHHPNWMLRDASLKILAALKARELSQEIESCLKDQALIVRTTAVDTIGHLQLMASAPKLVDALFDPINYHHGRALWIHQHILQVLSDFHYAAAIPKLKKLLQAEHDQTLKAQVTKTLEILAASAQ